MEFYIAQAISILTCIVAVVMVQLKSMKQILTGQIIANLLSASTYFLLGGLSGAGICFVAIVQSVVMYIYDAKKIKPHLTVVIGFIAAYILCSVVYYKSPVDIFSALAAIAFAMSVVQTKPQTSKCWYCLNPFFWLIYDVFNLAFINLVMHLVIFISTLIAIFRERTDEPLS